MLRAAHCAGQNAALPVHQLRRAIGNNVGAKVHRALQHAGGKGIVNHRGNPMFLRQSADIGHVDNVHRRVGRRFKEEHFRVRLNRRLPRIIVAAVYRGRADAPFGKQIVGQPTA